MDEDAHSESFQLSSLIALIYVINTVSLNISLSIGINVRFAAMMADVGDGKYITPNGITSHQIISQNLL